MTKLIKITILYDKELEKITKIQEEKITTSTGATFTYLLFSRFMEYPEMDKKYPPGKLGFLVNGNPPQTNTKLKDGDIILMSAKS